MSDSPRPEALRSHRSASFDGPDPATEQRQTIAAHGWSEHHRLLLIDDGRPSHRGPDENAGSVGGATTVVAMQVGVRRDGVRNAASFHCAVLRDGEDPLVIVESEIEAPDRLWEFRTSGLWVDTICETPYVHWSYGLEAFALAIEDPEEMLGRGYGDRVPLGWELEFESEPDRVVAEASGTAFTQIGHAHGLLLLAAGVERELAGRALRQHWWGDDAWAEVDALDGRVGLLDVASSPQVRSEVILPLTPSGRWHLALTDAGLRSVSHQT